MQRFTTKNNSLESINRQRISQRFITISGLSSALNIVVSERRHSISMVNYDKMEGKEEPQSMRHVAFSAIVFSTVAVTVCLVSFPLVFQYVQTLQATVHSQMEYCQSHSKTLWKSALDLTPVAPADRFKRQVLIHNDFCCCQQGPPGTAGPPGNSGRDGSPGEDGNRGGPGNDAGMTDTVEPYPQQCGCEGASGPQGPSGNRGPPGNNGQDGQPGIDGQPGNAGPQGPKGPPGGNGNPGPKGPRGSPGNQTPGNQGPPGTPGRPGQPGSPGQNGDSGNDGTPGNPGSKGPPGDAANKGRDGSNGNVGGPGDRGAAGPPGPCDHCPAARLAPGY